MLSNSQLSIFSALFYATASFLITVLNKIILTSYKFPYFQCLGVGQMIATILVLSTGKLFNVVSFPGLDQTIPRKICPLPFLFLGNMMFGLGGTSKVSLPMFTVLRRFTILLTMILEYWVLRIVASPRVKFCVLLMIGGALIAASNDLAFDLMGYSFLIANDFFTAAQGVIMKQKLNAKDLGKYGVLYYNALFMVLPSAVLAYATGEIHLAMIHESWHDPFFVFQFMCSVCMGFVLMYSIMLCTQYNSALTVTIIGALKNLLVTYAGMVIGGDYIFSWINFIGLNISVAGSIFYTYITFGQQKEKPVEMEQTKDQPENKDTNTDINQRKSLKNDG